MRETLVLFLLITFATYAVCWQRIQTLNKTDSTGISLDCGANIYSLIFGAHGAVYVSWSFHIFRKLIIHPAVINGLQRE